MRAFLFFLLLAMPAAAQQVAKPVLPEDVVKTVVAVTTKHYWGKATLKNGTVIEAETPEKAKQPPIELKEAGRIMDNAAPTAPAAFCRIEWKSYRDAYLRLEQRENEWSEAQMVFVERLFKSTHDLVLASMKRGYKCTDDIRNRAAEKLSSAEQYVAQELGEGLNGDNPP